MLKTTASTKVPWSVPKNKRIAIVDADGLLYSAALMGVTKCDGVQLQMLEDDAILANLQGRVDEVVGWCGEVKEVFLALSDRSGFRKKLLPTYKAQRKATDRPIALDALRSAVLGRFVVGSVTTPYTPILVTDLEADDVCGIAATTFQARGYETVVVSPDKDMLSLPGFVLTPSVRKGSRALSVISKERADRWHMYQTLVGDTCDNYKGCPGVGPARAEALLDYGEAMEWGLSRMWGEVVDQFLAHGKTKEDCLAQARVARILRKEDWDAKKKEPILWNFPLR